MNAYCLQRKLRTVSLECNSALWNQLGQQAWTVSSSVRYNHLVELFLEDEIRDHLESQDT